MKKNLNWIILTYCLGLNVVLYRAEKTLILIEHINLDIDELFKVMDGGKITINFYDSPMEDDNVEELSIMIENIKEEFKEEEYLSLVHSVLGEA